MGESSRDRGRGLGGAAGCRSRRGNNAGACLPGAEVQHLCTDLGASLGHGHSRAVNDHGKGGLPVRVALPLRRVVRGAKYVSGFCLCAAASAYAVFGDAISQRAVPDLQGGTLRRLDSSGASASGSAGASGDSGCGNLQHVDHTLVTTWTFLLFTFALCTLLDHFNLCIPQLLRFPVSVVMFISGIFLGAACLNDEQNNWLNEGMRSAAEFDPHALLYVLLPPLLFESASAQSWHVLRKVLTSATLLAVPGVILNTVLTGVFIKLAFRVDGQAPEFSVSCLLGAVLSATDPVAVVAALAALGAPPKLSSLVEGESLLNDGSAVVLVYVFKDWVLTDVAPEDELTCSANLSNSEWTLCVFGFFVRVGGGGLLAGTAAAVLLFNWIRIIRDRHSTVLELTIVLITCYGTFFVSEALKMSGVLAVVALGMCMTATIQARLSHHALHAFHTFMAQIGYACNQVTFFAAGVISARFMWKRTGCGHDYTSGAAWGELMALYVVIHFTRAAVVITFSPVLRRLGYGVTWQEGAIMVFGGLRGAVGLVMGLILEHEEYIEPAVKQMIAFHTSGIVLLTLLINGSLVDSLYTRLDPYPANPFRQTLLRKVFHKIEERCRKKGVLKLKNDWFFKGLDWHLILRCVPNFDFIRFDLALRPIPDRVVSVAEALYLTEREAVSGLCADPQEKFRQPGMQRTKTLVLDRKDHWARRTIESEASFLRLANQIPAAVDRRDFLHGVQSASDSALTYKPGQGGGALGVYVSSRPVSQLIKEDDVPGFEVKLSRMDNVVVVVGLVAASQAGEREHEIMGSVEASMGLLGRMLNTVGINCATGCVKRFNDADDVEGDETAPVVEGVQRVSMGAVISFQVTRPAGGNWEVALTVDNSRAHMVLGEDGGIEEDGAAGVTTSRIPFCYPPNELYPVVEFRRRPGKEETVGKKPSEKTFGESLGDTLGAAVGRLFSLGSDGEESAPGAREDEAFGKVGLSFQMQVATDYETVSELFHTVFNTVRYIARKKHESGIIGQDALFWIIEAIEDALDCGNLEVNALRMADFRSHPDVLGALSRRGSRGSFAGEGEEEAAAAPAPALLPDKHKFICLFEPLVVEYLSLKGRVSADSVFDRFPESWPKVRNLGYSTTRTKVEALWCFIAAHEKVVEESPVMERFPVLSHCVNQVCDEARKDLEVLMHQSPRRFYYSQNGLALRIILSYRLKCLEEKREDGWLSAGDSSAMIESLWERMLQAEEFYPRARPVLRGYHAFVEKKQKQGSTFFRQLPNAWDDVKL